MIKIYGTPRCPDCVECCKDLDAARVEYEFLDFDKDLKLLKDFLKLRDEDQAFDPVRTAGNIGSPCILREDGTLTLDWKEWM